MMRCAQGLHWGWNALLRCVAGPAVPIPSRLSRSVHGSSCVLMCMSTASVGRGAEIRCPSLFKKKKKCWAKLDKKKPTTHVIRAPVPPYPLPKATAELPLTQPCGLEQCQWLPHAFVQRCPTRSLLRRKQNVLRGCASTDPVYKGWPVHRQQERVFSSFLMSLQWERPRVYEPQVESEHWKAELAQESQTWRVIRVFFSKTRSGHGMCGVSVL